MIFDNGEKTKLVSSGAFNCKGKNLFRLRGKTNLFKKSTIKGLKYTNTRNYEAMVFKENLEDEAKTYIKDLLIEVDQINKGAISMPICEE